MSKVALITGGAGGIGSAICKRLALAGFSIIIAYRNSQEKAQQLLTELDSSLGQDHQAWQVAVDNSERIAQLAAKVKLHYGKLDALINNAGFSRFVAHDDLEGLDDALFDNIFVTNVRGAFAMIRAHKPLLNQAEGPVIINISSIAAKTGNGSNVAYCASKAALDSMTRSLARALAPKIRVLSIAPGLVEGEYSKRLDINWNRAQKEATPLKRLALAEDVAEAVYVAVLHLPFSTGDIIAVDGGRRLS
ncbi:MAG: SDR family oxidoreductase [Deinococcales bacterium]